MKITLKSVRIYGSKSSYGSEPHLMPKHRYIELPRLENIRILELNKHINRTIMGALKYKHPIEALKMLLKSY